jgi:hypothetical protein
MAKEKKSWEEDSAYAVAQEEGSAAPPAAAQDGDTNELKITTNLDGGQNSWRHSEGTTNGNAL